MIAPTLQTERLMLRPIRIGDFDAYAAMMGSGRAGFMGGPYDRLVAWDIFCCDVGLWLLAGHGGLAIDRNDGETIGVVGINAGPRFPETELGWMLYDGHEGRGYATEAAAALRDWAFANLDLASLVSYVDCDNRASARVAERLGAVLDADAPRQPGSETDLVYRHRRAA